ncbi:MAG TPA: glycosyltransferase [Polyangiaceae bacterium]|nr:glycosyltransferase [Polyangiaceae bacterium]
MYPVLVILYCSVLLVLAAYGLHRAHLAYTCMRHARRIDRLAKRIDVSEEALPFVTVQLPLFNEATVARRLIESTGAMDYPRDRFEIQVLDDSTDETVALAEAAVRDLAARGIQAHYVRRPNRHGYKAGALDHGLKSARGELVAIFDADFIPQPSFLREVVGHFQDPQIGMVQTRWDHLNRSASLLTSIQALMLDGHHLVENRARFVNGCMFNFSGTGGIWRREAIDRAGGWQHDTLTEDLDLSYRAQLIGYRFVYRADVRTPAELPEDMSAFRTQQYRWAKGTVQTARKLLGRVWAAPLPVHQRVEAAFHMLPHFAYPMTVLLTLVLLPALVFMPATNIQTLIAVDLPLCIGATGSLASFYSMAEVAQGRSAWEAIRRLPMLIALGAGLAPHLSSAVWDGLRFNAGEFVRTPKRGSAQGRYRQYNKLPLAEMFLAAVSAASVFAALTTGHWLAAPFAALFCAGYSYVAVLVVNEQVLGARSAPQLAPAGVPLEAGADASRESGEMVRAA